MAKSYSIREASKLLDLSEQYIRKMIHAGVIKTSQVKINDYQTKHVIDEAELNNWRKRAQNHTSREDGRNKFVIYLSKSEEKKLRELMTTNQMTNVEKLLTRANPPK